MLRKQNRSIFNIFFIVLSCDLWLWTHAEIFTAVTDVEPLLDTYLRIIDDLDDYIQKEEQRISVLKKHLHTCKREHEEATKDPPNYLGNPINAFTIIKRLTADLDNIEESIKIGTGYSIKNVILNHDDVKYPTLEDLIGAAHALSRLQDTYNLNITDISEGILNGIQYSSPLSASDCYELGKSLYADEDYKNALEWMQEALKKYRKNPNEVYPFKEVDIMEYISLSYSSTNNLRSALEWAIKILVVDPTNSQASESVSQLQQLVIEEEKELLKTQNGETESEDNITITEERMYEALCRGEMEVPQEVAKNLYCRYLTENHPFLRLAPIKMEQRYSKPDIFLFHQVMSDHEIEQVKAMAKPRLKRAVVRDSKTGEHISVSYRISKSAWLTDEEDDLVARITRRTSDITGLSMVEAEDLQVVNYGIGGHYLPHYDFPRKHQPKLDDFNGNRIATVLYYMSDVAQGGATVFTELGLSVFPVKNAAVFWLNLHRSGMGDLATRHAACPVLQGSKWVSNKWIHEGGQELLRPCELEFQEEGILRDLPPPVPRSAL